MNWRTWLHIGGIAVGLVAYSVHAYGQVGGGFRDVGSARVADAKITQFSPPCNGIDDDAPAFQRAVNTVQTISVDACGAGYLLRTPVSFPAGVALIGGGGQAGAERIRIVGNITGFVLDSPDAAVEGLYVTHEGNGSILTSASTGRRVVVSNNRFYSTLSSATAPMMFMAGEYARVVHNYVSNPRTGAWAMEFDSTGAVVPDVNLGTYIDGNILDPYQEGKGVWVHGSGAHRPEGFHIVNNELVVRNTNLKVSEGLAIMIKGNGFGIGILDTSGGAGCVIELAPEGLNLFGMQILGNVIFANGTPTRNTGICKTGAGAWGSSTVSGNYFANNGKSIDLTAGGVTTLTITGNSFNNATINVLDIGGGNADNIIFSENVLNTNLVGVSYQTGATGILILGQNIAVASPDSIVPDTPSDIRSVMTQRLDTIVNIPAVTTGSQTMAINNAPGTSACATTKWVPTTVTGQTGLWYFPVCKPN